MNMIRKLLEYPKKEYIHPPQGRLSTCPGCALPVVLKLLLKVMGERMILVNVPGCTAVMLNYPAYCLEYPEQSIPLLSSPLGSAASFAGGLKSALMATGDTETEVVAFTGDGAAFDIGFGALSAAAERNENIIYICNDNEAYQNTGNQRSSATPWQAITTTNPFPAPKAQAKKDLTLLMADHGIPYAATATVAYPDDLVRKLEKSKTIKGFRFLHFLTPCTTGWQFPSELTIKVSRLAVETKVFPLFEVEDGVAYTINKEPKGIPIEEYIKLQGRYKHLTPEHVADIQNKVDQRWQRLQWLAGYRYNAK